MFTCAAAAEITAHEFANLVRRAGAALLDQPDGRADLAWRAVAALERVVFDEGLLYRVECAIAGQALDRGHAGTILHDGERQARD